MNIVDWLPRYYRGQDFLRDLLPGALVMDVACGEGDLCRWMAACGASVLGVDLVPDEIRRGLPRNRGPHTVFLAADAGKLPVRTAVFDVLTSFDTLEMIPNDTAAVQEFARVLKPGAFLVLSLPVRAPNAGDMFWEQRCLRRWLPRFLYTRVCGDATGPSWFDSLPTDLVYFRDYPMETILAKFPDFELVEYDYVLKRFSVLALDLSYGVRGIQWLGLKPVLYWAATRLEMVFCRGPKHRGYFILAKLRRKS